MHNHSDLTSSEPDSSEQTLFLDASTIHDSDLNIEEVSQKGHKHSKFTIIEQLGEGMGFGETSMKANYGEKKLRMAYVHTLKPTFFLVIDQMAFRQMVRHYEHMMQKRTFLLFKESPLLKDQSHFALKRLAEIIERMEKEVPLKQNLFREGEPANYVYLVVKGSFLV